MVTLAVSSIVILGGLSVMVLAVRYFNVTLRALEADTELLSALAVVKEHMTQAVDLRHHSGNQNCFSSFNGTGTSPISGINSSSTYNGRIQVCNSGNLAPGTSTYLAVFNAEMGQTENFVRGVSLGFITPRGGIGADGTGELFLTRSGGTNIRPRADSVNFSELVAADIEEVRVRSEQSTDQGRVLFNRVGSTQQQGMAVSAKITLTRRMFLTTERDYCYPLSRCSSSTRSKFVDRSRSVTVSLRNNLQLERGVAGVPAVMRKRTFGNIYFFRPMTPEF